jgi:FkbM family methyltransferase
MKDHDAQTMPKTLPTVEVDTEVGSLLLHPADEVITANLVKWRVWEAGETRFLSALLRGGDTFVDVGANVGYFSVLGASCVGAEGSVIAVEPEPRNLELLRANLARNGCAQASVIAAAAYSEPGWMPLALNESNRGDHRLAPLGESSLHVRCVRLDDVLPDSVDVIKIDTQGFDHDVVEGLSRTIERNPELVVMTELSLRELESRGVVAADVLAAYVGLGFELALIDGWRAARKATAREVLSYAAAAGLDEVTVVLVGSGNLQDPSSGVGR